MDPEHQDIFNQASRQMAEQLDKGLKPHIQNALYHAVMHISLNAAQDIQAERTRPPLDMCPEIARIYIEDPAAVPFAPCRGCKYPLPGHIAVPDDGQRLTYFNLCPICGIPLTDTPETVNVTNNNTENS